MSLSVLARKTFSAVYLVTVRMIVGKIMRLCYPLMATT